MFKDPYAEQRNDFLGWSIVIMGAALDLPH